MNVRGHGFVWSEAGIGKDRDVWKKKKIDIRQMFNARLAWKKWTT